MKLTMDPSKCNEKALIALVEGSNDREMMLELFDATSSNKVRGTIIQNCNLTPDDREILYDKATDKFTLYGALIESELNSATIDKIVEDLGNGLINYYDIVKQDNISTEALKKVCNHIIENSIHCYSRYIEELLEDVVKHDNADEETIEKVIVEKPSIMPKVMLRHDVTVKIILNKQKEE